MGSRDGIERVARAPELPTAGWHDLVGVEDFFQTPRWLSVQERAGGTRLEYLVRRCAGRAVAGLVTAWADESVPWLLARPDTLLEYARREGLDGAQRYRDAVSGDLATALLPSLVCGGRHLGRTRVLTRPEADRSDLDALVRRAEQLAGDCGAATVCFPHVDIRDAGLVKLLEDRGYDWHTSAQYCWLPVPAGGFEEYLAGMTQHRRRRVRLERRILVSAGVRVDVEPLTAALTPRLGELDAMLLAKYGNPADASRSASLLAGIGETMGDDALVSVARLDSRIIGFGLVLRSSVRGEQHWFGHRAGFDYAQQGQLPLYYEVLYYRVLEEAAAAGAAVLHAGIGSTNAKLARGCLASEQRSFLLRLSRNLAAPGHREELVTAGHRVPAWSAR